MSGEAVPVTQVDREAAADIWSSYVAKVGEVIVERQMRKGELDEGLPSALARHRLAHSGDGEDPAAEISRLAHRMLEIAPAAGLHVGIKISDALALRGGKSG